MIKGLKKESATELYYYINGKKVLGKNELMLGYCSGLWGDCTGLLGNCSGLWGDCTGLRGNCTDLCGDCTGLRGNCTWVHGSCTGLWGNLDLCKITDLDRQSKINLDDLIQ